MLTPPFKVEPLVNDFCNFLLIVHLERVQQQDTKGNEEVK
jgi:hypothetical protein